MVYFNAIVLVSKNKKFLAIKYTYLGLKRVEAECRDSNDHVPCNSYCHAEGLIKLNRLIKFRLIKF